MANRLQGVLTFYTGLSDHHDMACFASKVHVPKKIPRTIIYRTYKNFNETKYLNDLQSSPFHVTEIFESVDDIYWFQETLLKCVVDENAPLKRRIARNSQLSYMNGNLRREINYKNINICDTEVFQIGNGTGNTRLM